MQNSVAGQDRAEEVDLGLRPLSVNVEKLGDHVPAQQQEFSPSAFLEEGLQSRRLANKLIKTSPDTAFDGLKCGRRRQSAASLSLASSSVERRALRPGVAAEKPAPATCARRPTNHASTNMSIVNFSLWSLTERKSSGLRSRAMAAPKGTSPNGSRPPVFASSGRARSQPADAEDECALSPAARLLRRRPRRKRPGDRRPFAACAFAAEQDGNINRQRMPLQQPGETLIEFRRMACDCCKTSDAPKLCQAPTYVMSEVTDNSNVIFVLMTKRGKRWCGGPLAVGCETRPAMRRRRSKTILVSQSPSMFRPHRERRRSSPATGARPGDPRAATTSQRASRRSGATGGFSRKDRDSGRGSAIKEPTAPCASGSEKQNPRR